MWDYLFSFSVVTAKRSDRNQVDLSHCRICIQEHSRRGGTKRSPVEWSEDPRGCACLCVSKVYLVEKWIRGQHGHAIHESLQAHVYLKAKPMKQWQGWCEWSSVWWALFIKYEKENKAWEYVKWLQNSNNIWRKKHFGTNSGRTAVESWPHCSPCWVAHDNVFLIWWNLSDA